MLNTESLPAVEIIAWWDENDANRTIARMNTIGRMIREGVFKISIVPAGHHPIRLFPATRSKSAIAAQ